MWPTFVRRYSSTEITPGSARTPAASRFRPSMLPGQPTAKNTASAAGLAEGLAGSVIKVDGSCLPVQGGDEGVRGHRHAPSCGRRGRARPRRPRRPPGPGSGPASNRVTATPKSSKMDAIWQPVSAPPITATRPGRLSQRTDVLVGERQFGAGDRETGRVPADGEDDPVRGPGPPVARGHRVRPGEADRAEMLDQVDAVPADVARDVLLLVGVAGHPLAVGQHRGQVGDRRRAGQAELRPGRPVTGQPGRARQRPYRRRPGVEAGPADLGRLEQR